MNCKQVQELLPLYVARDLEEKRAQLVTTHVESCAECANSTDEYRETRQLLQQSTPPAFSEEVYNGIRQRVLREIGRESPESIAPTLPQLVAMLFRPRIRWAVATALLLAVFVFGFYFIAHRRPNLRNDPQQVAGSPRPADRPKQDEQPNPRSQGQDAAAAPSPSSKENNGPRWMSTGANTDAGTTIAGTHQSQRRKGSGVAADRTGSFAANKPDTRTMTAEASPDRNNLAEPNAVPAGDPTPSEKTLRMEMQTKDPNIRIIWFSHQRTKQDSPSSKGI